VQVVVQSFIKNLGDLESGHIIIHTGIQTGISLSPILIQENINLKFKWHVKKINPGRERKTKNSKS
jgi:hypothetical protein